MKYKEKGFRTSLNRVIQLSHHCHLTEWAAPQLRVRNMPTSIFTHHLHFWEEKPRTGGVNLSVCDLDMDVCRWDAFVSHLFSPEVPNSCHGDRVPRVTKAWGDNVSDREWSKTQPMAVKAWCTSYCQQADWLIMKKQRETVTNLPHVVSWRYF